MARTLLLDTSARQGQVALAEHEHILAVARLEAATRRAGDLASVVQRLLSAVGWKASDLTSVVCGLGPGSFTGLRVGLASAKALSYAVGAAFVGVETFAALVACPDVRPGPVTILADGLQGHVFTRSYLKGATLEPTTPLQVQPLATWLPQLVEGTQLSGPGCALLTAAQRAPFVVLPEHAWEATPAGLLQATAWPWACERDVWRAEPYYLRGSSAEEKRQATLVAEARPES